MFNTEIDKLSDIVVSTLESEQGSQLLRKVTSLKNLCKTMNDLIKNIVSEIDSSRE